MRPALCLESSLPCQAGLASGPTSLPRTQQSRSVGAAVTTPAHPPTALGGRESGYPISQTKKRRLRKVAGVLGPGDPVAKPALQRHCHAKPWLGAAPSGPQLRPQSPVLGAREGHPPAGSTGPGARRCLESGLSGPQSPVRGGGCPQGRKGGAQVRSDRGHRTHPAHGLEEVSGVPPGAEAAGSWVQKPSPHSLPPALD